MNRKSLIAITLVITTTLTTGSVFAVPYDNHNDSINHDRDYQNLQNNDAGAKTQQWDHNQPRYMQNRQAYRQDLPRPHQDWHPGQVVPYQYRGKDYYVNDWRSHDLPPPPYGHRWMNVNGDYVLVAVATGIIANILPGGHN
mgnify:CR=1 FL=1